MTWKEESGFYMLFKVFYKVNFQTDLGLFLKLGPGAMPSSSYIYVCRVFCVYKTIIIFLEESTFVVGEE